MMPKRGDIFGSIPVGKIGRTNFNLSHQLTGNFKEGLCYPVFCEDSLPGDSWTINVYNISKLETLISPAMQRTNAGLLWFKIPKRLLMRQFKKWYTGGTDGESSVEKPYIKISTIVDFFFDIVEDGMTQNDINAVTDLFFGPGSLWQMLGLPIPYDYSGSTPKLIPPIKNYGSDAQPDWAAEWTGGLLDEKIDLIPFIAYSCLYDEFFRDQTLSRSVFADDISEFPILNVDRTFLFKTSHTEFEFSSNPVCLFDGGEFDFGDIPTIFLLFRRAWQKDYFTSALPTPQRGPEVTLDFLADQRLNVQHDGTPLEVTLTSPSTIPAGNKYDGSLQAHYSQGLMDKDHPSGEVYVDQFGADASHKVAISKSGGYVDMSGLSTITIAAFRNLFKLQAFLEKNNIAGGRFIEFILAHWAERVPDFTVQRPVFVRATQLPINVSEVTSTAATGSGDHNDLVGDQAGRAKGQGNLGKCSIYTQEPSIIIGIYCVSIPPSYAGQGIPKKFQRMTRWDEPYAEFQHIGEQAILNKEIFVSYEGDASLNNEFGYQQRYSEFKYLPDRVVGDFATSLAYWNQARIFPRLPHLNQTFIEQDPSDRIFAVKNEKPVIADFWFEIKCSRKLSKFSTPKLN